MKLNFQPSWELLRDFWIASFARGPVFRSNDFPCSNVAATLYMEIGKEKTPFTSNSSNATASPVNEATRSQQTVRAGTVNFRSAIVRILAIPFPATT